MSELPFDSFDAFLASDDTPDDEEAARVIWDELELEAESEHGDVSQLWAAIKDGAGLLRDVGVDILSGVDLPAVDSHMMMLKEQGENVWGGERPILLAKDDTDEKRISYAAAMIPREPDAEGDVVGTERVERAAHNYLKDLKAARGDGVDVDHNLIDDKGEVVESWILKERREFALADGGTKTYEPGTWLVGIEWVPEAWKRVKSGDITGLSIYGMAEHMALDKSAAIVVVDTAKQDFPEEWPFEDSEDGVEACMARLDGEVDDPEAFCWGWKEHAASAPESVNASADNPTNMGTDTDMTLKRELTFPELVDLVGTLTPEGVTADAISDALGDLLDAADESMEDNPDHAEEEETEADATRTDKGESVESATMSEDTEPADTEAVKGDLDNLTDTVNELKEQVGTLIETDEEPAEAEAKDIDAIMADLAEAMDVPKADIDDQLKPLFRDDDEDDEAETEEVQRRASDGEETRKNAIDEREASHDAPSGLPSYLAAAEGGD